MKAVLSAILSIGLLCSTLFAQNISDFNSITAVDGIHVELIKSSSARLENPSNLPLEVSQEGKSLKIGLQDGSHNLKNNKIKLYYSSLRALVVKDGAMLTHNSVLKAPSLSIICSDGGNLKLGTSTETLSVVCKDGGNIKMDGNANKLNASVKDGGNFNGGDLNIAQASVVTEDGGNVKLHVTKSLTASAKNGGNLSYTGNPSNVLIDKNDTGSITKQKTKTKSKSGGIAY
ncbi:MAG: head GIN domain-containing protein [Bacteroidota bacterium]